MTDVKTAIYNRAVGDSTYLGLVGNPSVEPFQTFYINPPERPTFPETVFWLSPELYNEEIGGELLESQTMLHWNVWARTVVYEQIAERLIKLFHQIPDVNFGFRAILDNLPEEMYDNDFNTYGLALNFLVFFRRGTI